MPVISNISEIFNLRVPNSTNGCDEFIWEHQDRRIILYIFDRRCGLVLCDGLNVYMSDAATIESFDVAIQWLFRRSLRVETNKLSLYEALIDEADFSPPFTET